MPERRGKQVSATQPHRTCSSPRAGAGGMWATPPTPRAERTVSRKPRGSLSVSLGTRALVADSRVRRHADDLVTGRGERVPQAAEGVHALAVGVAGLLVTREEVERVALVGDLWFSVRAGAGRDDRSSRSAADRGFAGRP